MSIEHSEQRPRRYDLRFVLFRVDAHEVRLFGAAVVQLMIEINGVGVLHVSPSSSLCMYAVTAEWRCSVVHDGGIG